MDDELTSNSIFSDTKECYPSYRGQGRGASSSPFLFTPVFGKEPLFSLLLLLVRTPGTPLGGLTLGGCGGCVSLFAEVKWAWAQGGIHSPLALLKPPEALQRTGPALTASLSRIGHSPGSSVGHRWHHIDQENPCFPCSLPGTSSLLQGCHLSHVLCLGGHPVPQARCLGGDVLVPVRIFPRCVLWAALSLLLTPVPWVSHFATQGPTPCCFDPHGSQCRW